MKRFLLTPALTVLVAASTVTVADAAAGKGGRSGGSSPQGGQSRLASGSSQKVGQSRPTGGMSSNVSKPSANGVRSTTPVKFAGSHNFMKDYHKTHGTSFAFGTCYKGNCHNQWSHYCYSNTYGCYCYWCPYTTCYYYWYAPSSCYYPINYISYAAPTSVCAPPVVESAPVCTTSSYTVPVNVQVTSKVSQGGIIPNSPAGGPPPAP